MFLRLSPSESLINRNIRKTNAVKKNCLEGLRHKVSRSLIGLLNAPRRKTLIKPATCLNHLIMGGTYGSKQTNFLQIQTPKCFLTDPFSLNNSARLVTADLQTQSIYWLLIGILQAGVYFLRAYHKIVSSSCSLQPVCLNNFNHSSILMKMKSTWEIWKVRSQ